MSFQTENFKLFRFSQWNRKKVFVNNFVSDFPFWKKMMGRADKHVDLSKRASSQLCFQHGGHREYLPYTNSASAGN